MAELVVELTFPAAPITSLQKRIAKGIEQLYYTKLFLTAPAYADGDVWRQWHERGFHIAIFSPPPGVEAADRIRVRIKAPSATPRMSVTGDNADALQDLAELLRAVDIGRAVVTPLVDRLTELGLSEAEIADFQAMLQRGIDALTDDTITAIDVSMS